MCAVLPYRPHGVSVLSSAGDVDVYVRTLIDGRYLLIFLIAGAAQDLKAGSAVHRGKAETHTLVDAGDGIKSRSLEVKDRKTVLVARADIFIVLIDASDRITVHRAAAHILIDKARAGDYVLGGPAAVLAVLAQDAVSLGSRGGLPLDLHALHGVLYALHHGSGDICYVQVTGGGGAHIFAVLCADGIAVPLAADGGRIDERAGLRFSDYEQAAVRTAPDHLICFCSGYGTEGNLDAPADAGDAVERRSLEIKYPQAFLIAPADILVVIVDASDGISVQRAAEYVLIDKARAGDDVLRRPAAVLAVLAQDAVSLGSRGGLPLDLDALRGVLDALQHGSGDIRYAHGVGVGRADASGALGAYGIVILGPAGNVPVYIRALGNGCYDREIFRKAGAAQYLIFCRAFDGAERDPHAIVDARDRIQRRSLDIEYRGAFVGVGRGIAAAFGVGTAHLVGVLAAAADGDIGERGLGCDTLLDPGAALDLAEHRIALGAVDSVPAQSDAVSRILDRGYDRALQHRLSRGLSRRGCGGLGGSLCRRLCGRGRRSFCRWLCGRGGRSFCRGFCRSC